MVCPYGLHLARLGQVKMLRLAGRPKSRRIEVSPGKQAWVDGMMAKAKKASAEKKDLKKATLGTLARLAERKGFHEIKGGMRSCTFLLVSYNLKASIVRCWMDTS
jgi:hypothetical protein